MSRFIYCYVECRNAECRYAECRCAECRGAFLKVSSETVNIFQLQILGS
jgi:hypothetical protein